MQSKQAPLLNVPGSEQKGNIFVTWKRNYTSILWHEKRKQILTVPEMNSNSNSVHGVSMAPNEKSSKKYALEPKP